MNDFPVKSYLLNPANCFAWFSPEWNREFRETLHETYEVNSYMGRSFFDLLAGSSIRLIYGTLFQLLRRPGAGPIRLSLRCDRAPFKIMMDQELDPQDDGSIKVELSYTRLELVEPMAEDAGLDWREPMKMCSWCQSIFDAAHAVWLPLEKGLGSIPILHEPELPAITHGCCPACYQSLRGQLHEYSCGR